MELAYNNWVNDELTVFVKRGITMNFLEKAEAIGLEEDEFMELVGLYIDTTNSDLLNLKNAVESGDIESMISYSHSIKGASSNMGFTDIFEIARELESKGKNGVLDSAEEAIDLIKEKVDAINIELENRD